MESFLSVKPAAQGLQLVLKSQRPRWHVISLHKIRGEQRWVSAVSGGAGMEREGVVTLSLAGSHFQSSLQGL